MMSFLKAGVRSQYSCTQMLTCFVKCYVFSENVFTRGEMVCSQALYFVSQCVFELCFVKCWVSELQYVVKCCHILGKVFCKRLEILCHMKYCVLEMYCNILHDALSTEK